MQTAIVANPFALMLNPEEVFRAIEHSERLGRLQARICRPLDKPLIPKVDDETLVDDDEADDIDEA